ncbi:ATP-binding cassette domain-containing protein [Streptomyces sp. NPDC004542]|uniref:ABC transporter ATP-binding protein n=1 Tax=Streptomyces sp. NPDC004542 TaxID=3154281 RepID=UPI0033A3657F
MNVQDLGTTQVLALSEVSFVREGRTILSDISFTARRREHWAVIGPNGAGKTCLMNMCAAVTHPSSGSVEVLGHRLGRVDLRELRRLVGFVQPRHPLRSRLTVRSVVLTGVTGTIEIVPRWEPPAEDAERAEDLVRLLGIGHVIDDPWTTLSQGERGRTLIARALMARPPLLLLDEPSTGLDMAAREQLLERLAGLSDQIPGLTTVTITHHLEELPTTTTHAILLRRGRIVAAGPVREVLSTGSVSETFEHPVEVHAVNGRWMAQARGAART